MEYDIYIDTLFLTNFIMDLIALWTVKLLLKRKRKLRYLVLASLFTSLFSVFLFLFLHSYALYQLCLHFLVQPLAVLFAYGSNKIKKIMIEYGFVYIGTLFLGGILDFAYVNLGNMQGYWIIVAVTVILILIGLKLWEHLRVFHQQIFEVTLQHQEHRSVLTGFFDTGNLLTDPYCNQPVHIIESQYMEPIIRQFDLKVRYIPFHSLGKQHGLLPVVTLDYMYIRRENSPVCIEKPVCGLAKDKLFQNSLCQILLNAKIDLNCL